MDGTHQDPSPAAWPAQLTGKPRNCNVCGQSRDAHKRPGTTELRCPQAQPADGGATGQPTS